MFMWQRTVSRLRVKLILANIYRASKLCRPSKAKAEGGDPLSWVPLPAPAAQNVDALENDPTAPAHHAVPANFGALRVLRPSGSVTPVPIQAPLACVANH